MVWLPLALRGLSRRLLRTIERAPADFAEERVGPGGGAPAQRRLGDAPKFLIVALELALILLVIRQFQLESHAFLRITLLAVLGFALHHLLPFRYRLPFFLMLSLAAIWLVFGFLDGAWLIGVGLILIGICHLPIPFPARIALLLVTGAALAALRVEWMHAPWSRAIWPILGSMFMFRLIVYLYDLRHDNAPPSVSRTLAYFFLLPNVCFPLFPVIDYKTFRRSYYSEEPFKIYQQGVDWMVRGIIHLILYRSVYYYLTLSPAEVATPSDLVRHLISNFLLYLRISGQFHLVVGLLHLFGFNLPETNHHYYLASGFTDFWRRINIYWKDFMLKVFFYPAYFKLRTWGTTKALVLSTLFVFFVTWLLHSYQWFWLRGSVLVSWQDGIFWGTLALLVVANSLYELRRGRERVLRGSSLTVRGTVTLTLRTVGTFSVMSVLWSLWTADSLSEWLVLGTAAGDVTAADASLVPVLLIGGGLLAGLITWLRSGRSVATGQREGTFQRTAAVTLALLLLLSLIGFPAVYSQLGPNPATVIHNLRSGRLSRLDAARLERGYYEELAGVERLNTQLWEVYTGRPVDWLDVQGVGLARPTGDFLQRELAASTTSYTSRVTLRTNRWGMRDRDYEKRRPPDTYRIALLGASTVMGMGVEDNETFEALLEQQLINNGRREGVKYEILNFGVSNYRPLQQLVVLKKALSFEPNAVFYVTHGGEATQAALYLAQVIRDGVDIPYEYLRQTARRAGIDKQMTEAVAVRRLRPFREEILSWLYHEIVTECRRQDVIPVWIHLPMPDGANEGTSQPTIAEAQDAEKAGFIVLRLKGLWKDRNADAMRLAEWDYHPNAKGHQLIAARLYEVLRENETILWLGGARDHGAGD